ncbi:trypsin-like serine protease with C-terminal PDZ domain [Sanguibacter keddieii DSM 10542]|uniref:Trypsin-like serine protease with C-terminal PDZ domain n=1 Tax=Sanguibacter keddieii (strain ATCC 51767 / DSM 10542 / NCFB 3025 / ST-74) TaxID=446469 RepID=D1BKL5_SANKS|nr:trypsin-like peptidase domain-containing protein [Sanguibacter keddieii]ACZ22492.1 trypsin-like serine protease with C-terminal PDZ domain [Sanguibacter keddieii DSM 10542]
MTDPSTDDPTSEAAGPPSQPQGDPGRSVLPVPLPPVHAAPSYQPRQEGSPTPPEHLRYAPPAARPATPEQPAHPQPAEPQAGGDRLGAEAGAIAAEHGAPGGTGPDHEPSPVETLAAGPVADGAQGVPVAPSSSPLRPPSYAPGATPSAHWFESAATQQEALVVTGTPSEQRKGGRRPAVTGLLVGALLLGAVGGIAGERVWDAVTGPTAGQPLPTVSADPSITRPDGSIADIAATVAPSVVSLYVSGPDGQSTGSGFIIREDGYILTNNHVIAGAVGAGTIRVTFVDGTEETATLIGRTADYDLAVVRVDREGLVPLVLGDSDAVAVGDPVIAIGAPLGLDGTVTSGIISALNRPVSAGDATDQAFINALQTDAAINPGNSGGPLVDGSGQVIGINSAIAQPPGTFTSAGNIGLGFAIGSNQARRTAQEIIDTGSASYPIIGVLLDSAYDGEGVQVVQDSQGDQPPVTPGGPAEAAGIAPGDVILAVDGRPVTQSDELIVAIRAKAPGDTVVLRVRSGDDERDVSIVLDKATSGEG